MKWILEQRNSTDIENKLNIQLYVHYLFEPSIIIMKNRKQESTQNQINAYVIFSRGLDSVQKRSGQAAGGAFI